MTVQKKKASRTGKARWVLGGLLVVIAGGVLLIAGIAAYLVMRQAALQWSGSGGLLGPEIAAASGTPAVNAEGTPIPPLPGAPDPGAGGQIPAATLTPWDGAGRVTVLLLGLDYRDWENQSEASRSDTMILLTLDPQTKTAGILSIPRDLWVPIPGFKHGKINTAYYLGDAYKLPGGGPALAVKTVETFLGVPINYYAQIDFEAFVDFIDQIGGVEIDVPYAIKVDMLGDGPRTIKTLKPGRQVLPGDYALGYARNRHTDNGDFDRAARQQQVIMAIRTRILSLDMLPTLVAKAPSMYSGMAAGIRTNLTLDEVVQLALMAQNVPEENIKRGIIDKDMVAFGFSPDGLSILIPYADDVQNLRDSIFATSGSLNPQVPGDALQQAQTEAAGILLLNGSSDPGFGDRAATFLRSKGLNVAQVAQAERATSASTLVDRTGSPYALRYLVELFNLPSSRISIQFDPAASPGLVLTLGDDLLRAGIIP
ncbi:MAG: LCP family protein [Chloroflexota bacterium]